jgi:hypothetical protein
MTAPFICMAVLQYPFYGWLVWQANISKKARISVWSIAALHVTVAALSCFRPPSAIAYCPQAEQVASSGRDNLPV